MSVAVLDYRAGNIKSVVQALNRLGVEALWTSDPEELQRAEKVIVPGVGEAASAMQFLRERGLDKTICSLKQPVLGICLGLQIFCESSEEGATACLGIFPNRVKKFQVERKVPHMGWNTLSAASGSSLFHSLPEDPYFYFVHSYFADLSDNTAGTTQYGESFSAALEKDNFYAVQFHPEKSADLGERVLSNFMELE